MRRTYNVWTRADEHNSGEEIEVTADRVEEGEDGKLRFFVRDSVLSGERQTATIAAAEWRAWAEVGE